MKYLKLLKIMKTKIVTSIYSDLHGSDLGGRPSRGGHYRYSLRTLLKMTDADFVCYTSKTELESLEQFFYTENNVSKEKLVRSIPEYKISYLPDAERNILLIFENAAAFEITWSG